MGEVRAGAAVRLLELRVLDGPNLYFTRPAVKLTLDVGGWLRSTPRRALAAAMRAATGDPGDPGGPETEQRRRFVVRLASRLTREAARSAGTSLGVRARAGPAPRQIVVAYPWRHRGTAEALGTEVAGLLDAALTSRRPFERLAAAAGERIRAVPPGPAPAVPRPAIPIVAVTGTNGKTTTVRLLAHLVRTWGRRVAYSSTDGVYVDGRLVEGGDYSGFAGAGRAIGEPGVEVAVLETARGGILLRGIGTAHNDVAVVTNVSSDHLGLHGIDTVDQLAEVKSTILRITRPDGWDVLNADDPRVLAMRRVCRGRPWMFSLHAEHPAIRGAVAEGGRGMTVIDGAMAVVGPGMRARPLAPLEEMPVTIAGISTPNVANAMAAAAAALAVGVPRAAVVQGLRTFVLDPERNPGRTNLFEIDRRIVIIDYAHNEAGMAGLVEVARGLRRPGREVWLSIASAGDRTDQIMHGLGYLAARGADHVSVAELERYLRGRPREEVVARLRAGAEDGGAVEVAVHPDELHALAATLERSAPGDVVAVTALAQRQEIFEWLRAQGGRRMGPARVRRVVSMARSSR